MHTQQKEKLINLIDTAGKLQEMLVQVTTIDDRITVLTKCQEVAISVGETLENGGEDDNGIVHLLEEYCEMIFALSQLEVIAQEDIRGVQEKLSQVRERLMELPTKYRVVFLPYKADMWDSLESIWLECVNDPRCECDVVPIPYFELNREEKKWEPRYDGQRFPADVPIIHYDYYKMDEMKPDVAYIHNPYDDCNHVTTVHPYYYSDELKKNVKKLVYVPYYVNAGFITPEQQAMPVCRNMDYMVVQSEASKKTCAGSHFYNKILPFGSPKFDKVIVKSHKGVEVPEQWREKLSCKKVLMLNTTINDILNYNEVLLTKLEIFFSLIKANDNVALIWRPHPLLEATIKSLRPNMVEQYKKLITFFEENEVGVLDLTGDVSNTVAISDAYVGSSYSSVINLFGVCGKPIFLFNNLLYNDIVESAGKTITFRQFILNDNKVFAIAEGLNGIYEINGNKATFVQHMQDVARWEMPYYSMTKSENKVYFSPARAEYTLEYDFETKNITKLVNVKKETNAHFIKNVAIKNKVFYIPYNEMQMLEYDTVSGQHTYHSECIKRLWTGCNFEPGMWRTTSVTSWGDYIWITSGHNHRVLQFNVEDGTYKIHYVGESGRHYSEIIADGDGLWLMDALTGDIVRWQYGANKIDVYHMPEEFECWKNFYGIMRSCARLIDMGDYLVTVPGHANYMVKINKSTGESCLLAYEFLKQASETVNGFSSKYITTAAASVKLDESHIMVQRSCDGMIAIIDVMNDTFEEFLPELTDEDFEKFMNGEDGFEKAGKYDYFCRRESKIFTIQGFIDDLVSGRLESVRERQLEALSTLAANLDGTCGKKVHEFMMNVLESEEN